MKFSLVVFFSFFLRLCVAEISDQQQPGETNGAESSNMEMSSVPAADQTGCHINDGLLTKLRELEDKQKNTERQLDYLRSTIQGIFTAPVRGMYYFSFSGHNISSGPMRLRLMKNGQQMVNVYNHAARNHYETVTNEMTQRLEPGDQVYIRLRQNIWIFDHPIDHSTFKGHLLCSL